jgi:hypothetical protein
MNKRISTAPLARSLLGLTIAWLAIGSASASDSAGSANEDANQPEQTNVTVGNVTVGVDPKTGELRPLSKAELATLQREMNRLFKARKLERIEKPDGSLAAVVAPNVLEYSVVRIEKDGTLKRTHVDNEQEALEFLSHGEPRAAAAPAKE